MPRISQIEIKNKCSSSAVKNPKVHVWLAIYWSMWHDKQNVCLRVPDIFQNLHSLFQAIRSWRWCVSERLGTIGVCDLRKGGDGGKKGGREREPVIIFLWPSCAHFCHIWIWLSKCQNFRLLEWYSYFLCKNLMLLELRECEKFYVFQFQL